MVNIFKHVLLIHFRSSPNRDVRGPRYVVDELGLAQHLLKTGDLTVEEPPHGRSKEVGHELSQEGHVLLREVVENRLGELGGVREVDRDFASVVPHNDTLADEARIALGVERNIVRGLLFNLATEGDGIVAVFLVDVGSDELTCVGVRTRGAAHPWVEGAESRAVPPCLVSHHVEFVVDVDADAAHHSLPIDVLAFDEGLGSGLVIGMGRRQEVL